jgi:hypothetical protein
MTRYQRPQPGISFWYRFLTMVRACSSFQLSRRNWEYKLNVMLHTFKAWMATFTSLWIAVLACFMGCMLPILTQQQSGPMPSMECCRSSDNAPARPSDGKPAPSHHGVSCCPVEVTVPTKWDGATMGVTPPQHFVLASSLDLTTTWFYSPAELVPSVWHSGRDTLLLTRLLRI